MSTSYKQLPDSARVWIYQSNRTLSTAETKAIKWEASKFIQNWMAHGQLLSVAFEIFYEHFLVFFVDESQTIASGCSIDESVNFVKSLEKQFNIPLLDRNIIAFKAGEGIATCTIEQFRIKIQKGVISKTTILFNNLVSTKKEFEDKWQVPLAQSWHSELLS